MYFFGSRFLRGMSKNIFIQTEMSNFERFIAKNKTAEDLLQSLKEQVS